MAVRPDPDYLLEPGFSFSMPFAPITLNPPSLLSKLNPSYALRARYTRRDSPLLGKPRCPAVDGGT